MPGPLTIAYVRGSPSASDAASVIAFAVSSSVVAEPSLATGTSLTEPTEIETVATFESALPSFAANANESAPWKPAQACRYARRLSRSSVPWLGPVPIAYVRGSPSASVGREGERRGGVLGSRDRRVGREGRVVDRRDGKRDGRHVRVRRAVVDLEGEGVGAAPIHGRGVGADHACTCRARHVRGRSRSCRPGCPPPGRTRRA